MPTIIDVAREAGVSTATVSRVLTSSAIVAESTRERVLAVVDTLRYRPNASARALRTLRAAKLLASVPDLGNPFFAAVLRGAEEEARAAGYALIIGESSDEERYADLLDRREVDGLIFLGDRVPAAALRLLSNGRDCAPVVNGCEYSPEWELPSVHIDNVAAANDAIAHLLGLGHRRIGLATGPLTSPVSRDRVRGVEEAIARVDGVRLSSVECCDYTARSGADAARRLIGSGVSAVFCFSDEMAIGALRVAAELGLRCPEDLSVVGFGDVRFAEYLTPALTTVSQPKSEIGAECVRLVLAIVHGRPPPAGAIVLPHQLVVRESTAPPRTPE